MHVVSCRQTPKQERFWGDGREVAIRRNSRTHLPNRGLFRAFPTTAKFLHEGRCDRWAENASNSRRAAPMAE